MDTQPAMPQASAWTNPEWWGGGGASLAGPAISQDAALKISTVYACVGLISETIASLPLVIYRYLENEAGRERARNHPLYELLHSRPNEHQTAFEFRQMMMAHALLRGSGYARIVPGARGFVDQLRPLHPDQVIKEKLTNGRIRYQVTEDDGRTRTYLNDEIFEVGGLSLDGWNTISVVSYARDSFGLTLAAEQFGGRFFRNDTRPGGVLTMDGKLTPDSAKRLRASWEAAHSGGNQWRVAVLENGVKWQQVGIAPDEAQFLESREFQAEDICRWFRVPPHMVGLTSKTTSWGSGIEQQSIGFVTYTLRPWLVRWQQAIERDLILAPGTYFADFVVEGLLRGDIAARYSAYATARQWGWMSVNEIRALENMNGVPGGDTYLTPMNMEPAGGDGSRANMRGETSHYRLLAEESAARLVRREIAALGRVWERLGAGVDWETAVDDFYKEHAQLVAETMRVGMETAVRYCEQQSLLMREMPPSQMDVAARAAALAEMAMAANEVTDG